ncbi:hypothetical protein [uncultured Aquimarina sp.]|uniref:hypothetical protein n=1 Tax=uncultured Aquimarina sp. TaxID=575652 RepID=UPI00263369AF|nr:hypothetical protein [uncultured Aquimarina sp.]
MKSITVDSLINIYRKLFKRSYWSIARIYCLFFLGELTKLSEPLVKWIQLASDNSGNIIWKSILNVIATYLSFEIPSLATLFLFLIFAIVSYLRYLEVRNNKGSQNIEELIRELNNRIKSENNQINKLPIPDLPTSEQEKILIDFLKNDVPNMTGEKFERNTSSLINYFSNLDNSESFMTFLKEVLDNKSKYSTDQKAILLVNSAHFFIRQFDYQKIDFMVEIMKKSTGLKPFSRHVSSHYLIELLELMKRKDEPKYKSLLNDKTLLDDLNASGVIQELFDDLSHRRKNGEVKWKNFVKTVFLNSYLSELLTELK